MSLTSLDPCVTASRSQIRMNDITIRNLILSRARLIPGTPEYRLVDERIWWGTQINEMIKGLLSGQTSDKIV